MAERHPKEKIVVDAETVSLEKRISQNASGEIVFICKPDLRNRLSATLSAEKYTNFGI